MVCLAQGRTKLLHAVIQFVMPGAMLRHRAKRGLFGVLPEAVPGVTSCPIIAVWGSPHSSTPLGPPVDLVAGLAVMVVALLT